MQKKWIFGTLVALALLLCGCSVQIDGQADVPPSPTIAPTPSPAPLNEPLPLGLSSEMTDGNTATCGMGTFTLDGGDRRIGSVYLVWDQIPGEWTLLADGEPITCGQNQFLHEYVTLPKPAKEVVIQADIGICELYAFEPDSIIPDWVQMWQPAWDRADLLLLSTHADDEHIFFGGMMPYYAAERGLKVQVAYLTHHWKQPPRPHELLDGLWRVGIRAYPVIGPFEDIYSRKLEHAKTLYNYDDVVGYEVGLLRRFQPRVVAGHALTGEYGHGVHMLGAHALTEAVPLAANPEAYPETVEQYGVWDTPKLYLHLYPENQILLDWYQPLNAFDGMTALDVAKEGYAMHKSQHVYAFYVYGEGDEYDSRKFGLYRSTVGPDVVGGDLFENITEFY